MDIGLASRRFCSSTARSGFVVLGTLGLAWSVLTLPTFWTEFPIRQFSEHIVRGETFPLDALQTASRDFRHGIHLTACSAVAAHGSAVVELAILDRSFATPANAPVDSQIEASRNSILSGLACLPSDAFLWFELYRIESLQSGLHAEYLRHLAMSYQVGANEGWIAILRNKAAFAVFPALTTDLKSRVLDEFCLLLRTELYQQAIDIFLGAAEPYRDLIIARMDAVPEQNRQAFADLLARMGVDAHIPGTSTTVRERS
jgi:hypothetical protein